VGSGWGIITHPWHTLSCKLCSYNIEWVGRDGGHEASGGATHKRSHTLALQLLINRELSNEREGVQNEEALN